MTSLEKTWYCPYTKVPLLAWKKLKVKLIPRNKWKLAVCGAMLQQSKGDQIECHRRAIVSLILWESTKRNTDSITTFFDLLCLIWSPSPLLFPYLDPQVWRINLLYAPSFLPPQPHLFSHFLFFSLLVIKAPVICQTPWAQVAASSIRGMPHFTQYFGEGLGFLKKEKLKRKKILVLPISIPKAQIIKKPIVWGKVVSNEWCPRKKIWFSQVKFLTTHELYGEKQRSSLRWLRYHVPKLTA